MPLRATAGAAAGYSESEAGGTIKKTYTVDASTSPAAGTWNLRVEDISEGATGTLNGWTLTF
ncbi:proprotein convertase P-domain-containing protein [Streptomyces sp. NPDC057136]|uniref:proprotein convertase P-domain-containing protein n=1 Tax=Streptomyces sp. NPDC057136 TaxID=3346029 RepID=UPI00363B5E47